MIPYAQVKFTLPMKNRLLLSVFALGFLAASQPMLAASAKAEAARNAALVAALQAVSADSLGGQLGLEVATARTPALPAPAATRQIAAQSPRAELDQRTYLVWKGSQKS